MKYCIALDGGGTKTDAVLFDENGRILCRKIGQGGNPTDIGVEEAQRRVTVILDELFASAPANITALYGGMAGVIVNGDIYSEVIRQRYCVNKIRFDDDGCNLISGTLGHADGGGMVCGTGSSLFIRRSGHALQHIGGKGYLIDTGGSGFELGKEAICWALRAVDGRCPPTILTELLAERIGMPIDDMVIPIVHRGGRPYIAGLAPAVFEGAEKGDRICQNIIERQAALLADLTFPAEKMFSGDFNIVIGGGIAAHFPSYVELIQSKAAAHAKLILQSAPPVYGAAVEAMWDADIEVSESVRRVFLDCCETFKQ